MSWEYLGTLLRKVMSECHGNVVNTIKLEFQKDWVVLTLTDPVSGNEVNHWYGSEDTAKQGLIDLILKWKK